MSVEIVTFGCRLNAFESEVIRREADGAGLSDTIVINSCAVTNEAVAQARQSIRRLQARAPGRAHRRHRLRGADPAARCSPTWPRSIASSAMTTRCAARPGARRGRRSTRALQRQDRRHRHHVGAGNGAASGRWFPARPAAGVRAGAERLRPSLHVLHHPLWPRQFTLGADGRGGRAGPCTGRARSCRDRADGRGPDELRRRSAGCAKTRHADEADPAARARR